MNVFIVMLGFIKLSNETFYHQTNRQAAPNIVANGFISTMHDGQARFTHGIYFLKHPKASYGEVTLSAEISGNFIDLTHDDMGDEWIKLRDSVNWDNYIDLTTQLRDNYPTADGIVFDEKYMVVVWYPERCIKNIQIL
jgi:hypothetical protein